MTQLENDLCGESSTHYTKLPDYPETVSRMKALLPSVKLIYVMRHPIERLISHYVHQLDGEHYSLRHQRRHRSLIPSSFTTAATRIS